MMTGFRLTYLAATACLGVAAVAQMSSMLLLGRYVDQILGRQEQASLLPLVALGFVGLALIQGTFTFLSGRWAARTAEGITLRLRNYLFDHIQRLPFHYHDRTATGELIQRCTSDVDALRRFFADQAIGVGRIVLLFAVNFSALLFLNRQLALLSIVVVPLVVVASALFFRKVSQAYEVYQQQDAVLSTTLGEPTGVRVVKYSPGYRRQVRRRQLGEILVGGVCCPCSLLADLDLLWLPDVGRLPPGVMHRWHDAVGTYLACGHCHLADLAHAQPGPVDRGHVARSVPLGSDGHHPRGSRTADEGPTVPAVRAKSPSSVG
jgi:hypothetical protein